MKRKLNKKEVAKAFEQAMKIRETLGGFFSINIIGYSAGSEIMSIKFYHINKESLIKNKLKLKIPNLTKEFNEGEESLNGFIGKSTLCFSGTGKCEIVGYKKKIIPATKETVEKIPIWKCQ